MSTLFVHPTVACDVQKIFKLQRATKHVVVISGNVGRMVPRDKFFADKAEQARQVYGGGAA